jgi:hypothetical protein
MKPLMLLTGATGYIWRIGLFAVGCIGLALYTGLFFGPLPAIAAAVMPQK